MYKYSPDELLKRITAFEKMALYVDRKSFLQSLSQGFDAGSVRQYEGLNEFDQPVQNGIPAPDNQPPSVVREPTSFHRNPSIDTKTYPSIPWQSQNMLSEIVSKMNIAPRIQIDGKLGPETQHALDAFKSEYFPKDSKISNDRLLKFVEEMYRSNPEAFK